MRLRQTVTRVRSSDSLQKSVSLSTRHQAQDFHSQSEQAIQTIKNLLKKAQESRGDPYLALLEYRNAPLDGVKLSPAQLLRGHRLKTKLPAAVHLLKPQPYIEVHKQMKERELKQKLYFNCEARDLPKLQEGKTVGFRVGKTWQPAVVKHSHVQPQPFVIQTPEGDTY